MHFFVCLLYLFLISCEIGTDLIKSPDTISLEIHDGTKEIHSLSLLIGSRATLKAIYNENGSEVSGKTFTWESSAPETVGVSGGEIEAKAIGQAIITTSYDTLKTSIIVSVIASKSDIAVVEITPPERTVVSENETIQLVAKAFDGNHTEQPDEKISWKSSNSSMALVDSNGTVRFLTAGSVKITASSGLIQSMPLEFTIVSKIRTGTFVPVSHGTSHKGTATLQELNGKLILEFKNDFVTASGPDLVVTLSNQSSVYASTDQIIAELKSTTGAQTYEISDVPITKYTYVHIWCRLANSVFSSAKLN